MRVAPKLDSIAVFLYFDDDTRRLVKPILNKSPPLFLYNENTNTKNNERSRLVVEPKPKPGPHGMTHDPPSSCHSSPLFTLFRSQIIHFVVSSSSLE